MGWQTMVNFRGNLNRGAAASHQVTCRRPSGALRPSLIHPRQRGEYSHDTEAQRQQEGTVELHPEVSGNSPGRSFTPSSLFYRNRGPFLRQGLSGQRIGDAQRRGSGLLGIRISPSPGNGHGSARTSLNLSFSDWPSSWPVTCGRQPIC